MHKATLKDIGELINAVIDSGKFSSLGEIMEEIEDASNYSLFQLDNDQVVSILKNMLEADPREVKEEEVDNLDWYYEKLEKADQEHPDMEDKYCHKCGMFLVKDSINYHEGYHFDGCPNGR